MPSSETLPSSSLAPAQTHIPNHLMKPPLSSYEDNLHHHLMSDAQIKIQWEERPSPLLVPMRHPYCQSKPTLPPTYSKQLVLVALVSTTYTGMKTSFIESCIKHTLHETKPRLAKKTPSWPFFCCSWSNCNQVGLVIHHVVDSKDSASFRSLKNNLSIVDLVIGLLY